MKELETAVMFWAGGDPAETLANLTQLGIRCGQLGIPGDLDLKCIPDWKNALEAANFTVTSVVVAYTGEDYADIPTVERTVGFIPLATRAEREQRTYQAIEVAAEVGAGGISLHIGFVRDDSVEIRDLVRRICDAAAKRNQTFALETGQESAQALLKFIGEVDRPNLGINFDPANMILYGTGDPIEALDILAPRILSVHCKDGDWPPPADPTALGKEQPLGAGAVGISRFLKKLREIGYKGPLTIEREGTDAMQWLRDIESGIQLLETLRQAA